MPLFDVHAHLSDARLLNSIEEVLKRAEEAGVRSILANGLNPQDNARVLELSQRYPMVKPCFGFYPVDAVLAEMREQGIEYPRDAPLFDKEEGIGWVAEHIGQAFAAVS
ncbi:MAG: TatD family hydrolase, partial [Deltaproteobacteria bacterium]|nr:TatD family hydrolase [Deltaproteobacteria bacterium]